MRISQCLHPFRSYDVLARGVQRYGIKVLLSLMTMTMTMMMMMIFLLNNALVDSERKKNALVFFTSSNEYFAEVSRCTGLSDPHERPLVESHIVQCTRPAEQQQRYWKQEERLKKAIHRHRSRNLKLCQLTTKRSLLSHTKKLR